MITDTMLGNGRSTEDATSLFGTRRIVGGHLRPGDLVRLCRHSAWDSFRCDQIDAWRSPEEYLELMRMTSDKETPTPIKIETETYCVVIAVRLDLVNEMTAPEPWVLLLTQRGQLGWTSQLDHLRSPWR